jgi:hypothetical protein
LVLHFFLKLLRLKLECDLALKRWIQRSAWRAKLEPSVTVRVSVRDPSVEELAIGVPDGSLLMKLKTNHLYSKCD